MDTDKKIQDIDKKQTQEELKQLREYFINKIDGCNEEEISGKVVCYKHLKLLELIALHKPDTKESDNAQP